MAWNAPITFVDGNTLTAAQLNAQLRDNMAQQAANKVTTYMSYVASTGPNELAERRPKKNTILAIDTTTSASYTDLDAVAGPTVNVETGTSALVVWGCGMANGTNGVSSFMSVDVSGATTIAATTDNALRFMNNGYYTNASQFVFYDTLNPGVNTFTCKYASGLAGSTAIFRRRRIFVYPY